MPDWSKNLSPAYSRAEPALSAGAWTYWNNALARSFAILAEANPTDMRQWQRLLTGPSRGRATKLPKALHGSRQSLGLNATELSMKVQFLCQTSRDAAKTSIAICRGSTSLGSNEPVGIQSVNGWRELCRRNGKTFGINLRGYAAGSRGPSSSKLCANQSKPTPIRNRIRPTQLNNWLDDFRPASRQAYKMPPPVESGTCELAERYEVMAMEMDFTLLYNPQRKLFSVGYNLEDGQADRSHYDMLASEARIASIIAIAKGDADHRHWFQLGQGPYRIPKAAAPGCSPGAARCSST